MSNVLSKVCYLRDPISFGPRAPADLNAALTTGGNKSVELWLSDSFGFILFPIFLLSLISIPH